MTRTVALLLLACCSASAAVAQTTSSSVAVPAGGARLGEPLTIIYQVGVIIEADRGPCRGLKGTVPIPIEWPEQQVQIVKEDIAPEAQVTYRDVDGTVRQMVIEVPYIEAGTVVQALVDVEITRHAQLPPEDTSVYVMPNLRKLPMNVRQYLGTSPFIESTHRSITMQARQLVADTETAWQRVEAIYDWTREHVEYQFGPLKGALRAMREQTGDCEDISSLFIALCRASGIPARTVWVPDHCYPEFYLEDAAGNGYWFPCQAAGTRDFGGIPEHRPILQKGDNFQVPERPRERQRYVAEYLTGKGGSPKVKFIGRTVDVE